MNLRFVPDVVAACLVLHDICICQGESFDMEWVREAKLELTRSCLAKEARRSAATSIMEIHAIRQVETEDAMERAQRGKDSVSDLGSSSERRDNLARAMYREQTRANLAKMFGDQVLADMDSSSSSSIKPHTHSLSRTHGEHPLAQTRDSQFFACKLSIHAYQVQQLAHNKLTVYLKETWAAMCEQDVLYSCGACGYHLKLSSSQRLLSSINRKALRKRSIPFLSIDESRIKQLDEFICAPYVHANGSMGLHKLRTRLLCGKCEKEIGHTHSSDRASFEQTDSSDSSSSSGTSEHRKFCIKIKALQPILDP
ncbi:hypothetical protein L7F22_000454 [Adiantum nelumboides]|nr:hypothetical protein [Adiantum nelumboides]